MNHKPAEIAVAVLHNKLKEKRGAIPPEVKLYLSGKELEDKWICYPWDALDIGEQNRQARAEKR
jgi:hypoxanthine phosphoribosyltransferase